MVTKDKKIALVGNIQNWNFALMCWLRNYGYDAKLFYQPNSFFKPGIDTFDIEILQYCVEVDWLKRGFPTEVNLVNEIKQTFLSFDFIIGSGTECAILNYCGIKLDIYIPLGSDFYHEPFLPHEYPLITKLYYFFSLSKNYDFVKYGTLAKYQYRAIKESANVILDKTNDEYESKFSDLNYVGCRQVFTPPFIYHLSAISHFVDSIEPSVHWKNIIQELRKKNEFIILYHGRHVWKDRNDIYKGTDSLVKGFANFIKNKSSKISCKLVLLEYGIDFPATRNLIEELGISHHVIWFPQMFRKDILYLITMIDLCCGEFGDSFLTFGTIVEAMLMGKPIIHYREDNLYLDQYPKLYPLLNCRSPEEISMQLLKYHLLKDVLKEMGLDAKNWCEQFVINEPLSRIFNIIESKS